MAEIIVPALYLQCYSLIRSVSGEIFDLYGDANICYFLRQMMEDM